MNEWKAFQGRITLFPTMPPSSSPPSALELYRQIWGGDPDSFQKQANVLAPAVAQGKRDGLIVNCVAQQARIDFGLMAAPSQEMQMTVALIDRPIGFLDELKRIIDIFDKGSLSIAVSRVALNLQFLNLNPSHAEANKAVTKIIPDRYGVTVTNEEDFIFQINQPKTSRENKDIGMNFITKWSVERFQILTISIPPSGVTMGAGMTSPSPQTETFNAASVLFDNNNIPGRALTGKEQSALLHEALDAAVGMQREIGLNIEGF